jgi:hypothetical protein
MRRVLRGLLREHPTAVDSMGSYTGRILKTTGEGLLEFGGSGANESNNPPEDEAA